MDTFGSKLRELRRQKEMTLRQLAELAGVDYTYLSKVETEKLPYTPSAETIRAIARALGIDQMELLTLANKLPEELEPLNTHVEARRFYARAQKNASPDDWDALLDLLEQRIASRRKPDKES